jgi:small neutral amino acid transporter SnatA (MarC family)
VLALGLGYGGIAVVAVFADDLLDALDVSPESFRIAAGLVLAATGVRELIWAQPSGAPFAAVLLTPELVCAALSFGADETVGRTLAAAAIALPPVALAALSDRARVGPPAARFLAALQIVVAVALGVSGVRDV